MVRVLCVFIGYVFGNFQTAFFYAKYLKGIDIRTKGSGNCGTTNTLRVLGPKAAAIVLLCDILKTGLAMTLVRFLFKDSYPDTSQYLLACYTAIGAILGHNYTFYLKFKGGKGIACTAGYIIFMHPYMILPEVITFFGIFFTTHYVSLGSLLVQVVLFIEVVVLGQCGVFGMSQAALNELYVLNLIIAALAFYGHRANIGRLIHKCERKTYITKKNEQ